MSQPSHCNAIVEREANGLVWVRTEARQAACGSCQLQSACTVVDSPGDGKLLFLPNTINAALGDIVVVEVAAGQVWKAAWQAYGRPLLLAFVAALAARHFTDSDGFAFAAMIFGLVAGFLLLPRRGLDSEKKSPTFSLKFAVSNSNFSSRL